MDDDWGYPDVRKPPDDSMTLSFPEKKHFEISERIEAGTKSH